MSVFWVIAISLYPFIGAVGSGYFLGWWHEGASEQHRKSHCQGFSNNCTRTEIEYEYTNSLGDKRIGAKDVCKVDHCHNWMRGVLMPLVVFWLLLFVLVVGGKIVVKTLMALQWLLLPTWRKNHPLKTKPEPEPLMTLTELRQVHKDVYGNEPPGVIDVIEILTKELKRVNRE